MYVSAIIAVLGVLMSAFGTAQQGAAQSAAASATRLSPGTTPTTPSLRLH